MYSIKDILRDRALSIGLTVFFAVFLFPMGYAFKVDIQLTAAVAFLLVVKEAVVLVIEYRKRYVFYREFIKCLDALDQKYLIGEMEFNPDFPEGRIMLDILHETDKSMLERIRSVETKSVELKEYMELWIHEIKLPLAALKLMNYNGTVDAKKTGEQLDKLNSYVEQILFYTRAETAENDYLMKKVNLEKEINKVIRDNKELLIGNKVHIEKSKLDYEIITDSKWLEFMTGQIVNNSIKYKNPERELVISFSAEIIRDEQDDKVKLSISDNGIGISPGDLPRVFDKSFTGENGRNGNSSTGMGLYICKRLCDKLGHLISIESEPDAGTTVSIVFGKNRFLEM
jgi:signal transduction histidine kinase